MVADFLEYLDSLPIEFYSAIVITSTLLLSLIIFTGEKWTKKKR